MPDFTGRRYPSAELYDQATGKWSLTAPMPAPHAGQTATLLRNGWVLVAGGQSAAAEIYQPQRATWVLPGAMSTVRTDQTATLLPGGQVLVTGGDGPDGRPQPSAEVFLAGSGPLVSTAPGVLAFGGQQVGTSSASRTYTVTNDGSADLVTSGAAVTGKNPGDFRASTDCGQARVAPGGTCTVSVRFAPGLTGLRTAVVTLSDNAPRSPQPVAVSGYGGGPNAWVPVGPMTTAREEFSAVALPDGKVLIAAGETATDNSIASAELYNPATGTWSYAAPMHDVGYAMTSTLLPDGDVLVTGFVGPGGNRGRGVQPRR